MRFWVTFIAAVLCASFVAAATATQPLSTAGTKRASVRVLACDRDNGEALFRAAMRRVSGTGRMAVKFNLLQREPGGPIRARPGPGAQPLEALPARRSPLCPPPAGARPE